MKFKFRQLTTNIFYKSGRNHSGKITVRHRAAGVNREVSVINSFRKFTGLQGLLINHKLDSIKNRNCPINIVYLRNIGIIAQFLSYNNSKIWDNIYFNYINDQNIFYEGSHYSLKHMPLNCKVFNVEINENRGGQIARAAGTYCRITKRYIKDTFNSIVQLELPSKGITYVSGNCIATLGIADNLLAKHKKFRKAGERRILGFRPRVRGVAMNPVDHPHGGGEGKTSGGRSSVSAWGWLTKGRKTVRNKFSKLKKKTKMLKRIFG
jgi:large subunit ribosomal protein L2